MENSVTTIITNGLPEGVAVQKLTTGIICHGVEVSAANNYSDSGAFMGTSVECDFYRGNGSCRVDTGFRLFSKKCGIDLESTKKRHQKMQKARGDFEKRMRNTQSEDLSSDHP